MIAIIDYGVGNLFSLKCSLQAVGANCVVTSDEGQITNAEKLILPGVGAFGDAADKLKKSGLDKVIKSETRQGKKLLGICLGMQLLFDKSYEYGEFEGLGLIEGSVNSLQEISAGLKIPHIGWNSLNIKHDNCPILSGITEGSHVYFVHSYYAKCDKAAIAATAGYGGEVTAVVWKNNVFGTQFHPEKSGEIGLKILKNFIEL